MPEARPMSLLDFAIAASIAVVPVLPLYCLAWARSRRPSAAHHGNSHVSVRQVAALKVRARDRQAHTVQAGAPGANA
jgi:hypothetical protein